MGWLGWTGVLIGVYLGLGVLTSVALYHTPYRDNGAILITLLWPLFWIGIFFR